VGAVAVEGSSTISALLRKKLQEATDAEPPYLTEMAPPPICERGGAHVERRWGSMTHGRVLTSHDRHCHLDTLIIHVFHL
jgi:hypothetical protein